MVNKTYHQGREITALEPTYTADTAYAACFAYTMAFMPLYVLVFENLKRYFGVI